MATLLTSGMLVGKVKADPTQIRVQPATTQAILNKDYIVYIEVTNVADLYGWQFDLDYNKTVLDLTSASIDAGGLNTPTNTFASLTDEANGHLSWAVVTRYPTVTGITYAGHAIFEIHFTTIETGTSALHLYETLLSDSQARAISHTAVDGSITVGVPEVESSNSTGDTVNQFKPDDKVYAKGNRLSPSSSYKIYIVKDYTAWTKGTTTLDDLDIIEGPIDATTNTTGHIVGQPIEIWDRAEPGDYDIFADCQSAGTTGTYDTYDAIDNLDVSNAGFFVIPEYALGTILALAMCFAAVGIFWKFKRRNHSQYEIRANYGKGS